MKVYFVGMHNKVGKAPLCSSTYSGKVIDAVIENIEVDCMKSNFADIDRKPIHPERYAPVWWNFKDTQKGDVIILLGKWVQRYFERRKGYTYIEVYHPSSFIARKDKSAYINQIILEIEQVLPVC